MNEKSQTPLGYKSFMRQFIELYRQQEVLWNTKHPNYKNRNERYEAYDILVNKWKEAHSDANEDIVRRKIDTIRCSFRKARRKYLLSVRNSKNGEVDKPQLWYYDLLLFTVGEECDEKNRDIDDSDVDVPIWDRKSVAILIELYRNYPCLYSSSHMHYRSSKRRFVAFRKITQVLNEATGKTFKTSDVRKRVGLLRRKFLDEYKKDSMRKSRGENYVSKLWFYRLMEFVGSDDEKSDLAIPQDPSSDEEEDNKVSPNDFAISNDPLDIKPEICVDSFDVTANNLGHQLRDMTSEQRGIAERILRDLMYHGQMENLTNSSRLSLDGT